MQSGRERRSGAGGWSVARLQRIGNWGRADEALGRHWEQVGLQALASLLDRPRALPGDTYKPRAVLALSDNEALRREVHASGLPNPDACLIGVMPTGGGVLQPVDFKWSLERAQRPQVGAETLTRLLEAPLPGVQALLRAARTAAGLVDGQLQHVDGFFFAPEHAENRDFMASERNAVAEWPLGAADVECWQVDPTTFFPPLPGWELGCWLAEMDRSAGLLRTVEGAERYFRLGAGFGGAIARLATPLFDPGPKPVDPRAELSRLRTSRRLFTSVDLARYLERQMTAREELQRGLRELEGKLYPFRQFRLDLAAQGIDLDAAEGPKRSYRERHRHARAAVRDWLLHEGRTLVATGRTDAAALADLQARAAELAPGAQEVARRALAEENSRRG
jgi:hypothetical protein